MAKNKKLFSDADLLEILIAIYFKDKKNMTRYYLKQKKEWNNKTVLELISNDRHAEVLADLRQMMHEKKID